MNAYFILSKNSLDERMVRVQLKLNSDSELAKYSRRHKWWWTKDDAVVEVEAVVKTAEEITILALENRLLWDVEFFDQYEKHATKQERKLFSSDILTVAVCILAQFLATQANAKTRLLMFGTLSKDLQKAGFRVSKEYENIVEASLAAVTKACPSTAAIELFQKRDMKVLSALDTRVRNRPTLKFDEEKRGRLSRTDLYTALFGHLHDKLCEDENNSPKIQLLLEAVMTCTRRMTETYIMQNKSPEAHWNMIAAAALSIAYAIFGLDEECGEKSSASWADLAAGSLKDFKHFQARLLKMEDFNPCVAERTGMNLDPEHAVAKTLHPVLETSERKTGTFFTLLLRPRYEIVAFIYKPEKTHVLLMRFSVGDDILPCLFWHLLREFLNRLDVITVTLDPDLQKDGAVTKYLAKNGFVFADDGQLFAELDTLIRACQDVQDHVTPMLAQLQRRRVIKPH